MPPASVELVPVRPALVSGAWPAIITSVAALLSALPFVDHPRATLITFLLVTVLCGLFQFLPVRRGLGRILDAPADAVVTTTRRARMLPVRVLGVAAVVVLAVLTAMDVIDGWIFGFLFGDGLGNAVAAREVGRFEREHGQQVLRQARSTELFSPQYYT